jgi:putative transposase
MTESGYEDFSMKRSRFTEQQTALAMQQAEHGTQVAEVTRKMGTSEQTLYEWKKKYGGLMPSEDRKLRRLEEERARLDRLVADLSLDCEMLQRLI